MRHHTVGSARFEAEGDFIIDTSQQATDLHPVSMLTKNLCDGGDEWGAFRRVAE